MINKELIRDYAPAAAPEFPEEADAPGSSYGDVCAEPSSPIAAEIDPLREAVERVYYDWWADNDHALSMGLPGDVLELRERLNAAFAKVSNCALVAGVGESTRVSK